MATHRKLLGKIFLSHSSLDKPFVRKLAKALEKEGFDIWLDEKQISPGDMLARKVSDGIEEAKAVLVVVSENSVKSRWLAFELNKATTRMVDGSCRVIPIIIDDSKLPPEVTGLLYSDFRAGFAKPLRAVTEALERDANALAREESFWYRTRKSITDHFLNMGWVSVGGAYKDTDYDLVYFDEEDQDTSAVYEIVSGSYRADQTIDRHWWYEFESAAQQLDEKYFVIFSERPVQLDSESIPGFDSRLSVKHIGYKERIYQSVVFVDLSGTGREVQDELVAIAKDALTAIARERRAT